MIYENTNPEKGPVGKWDAETKEEVGYEEDFMKWVDAKWEKSCKAAERYFFVSTWRQAFVASLLENVED